MSDFHSDFVHLPPKTEPCFPNLAQMGGIDAKQGKEPLGRATLGRGRIARPFKIAARGDQTGFAIRRCGNNCPCARAGVHKQLHHRVLPSNANAAPRFAVFGGQGGQYIGARGALGRLSMGVLRGENQQGKAKGQSEKARL